MMEQGFEGYRLSPQQMCVWRAHREGVIPLAQCATLIEGPLQIEILQRAVSSVVERHEILRTRFVRSAGIKLPFQVVMEGAQPDWDTEDWTAMPPAQHIAEIDRLLEEQRLMPADLERAPVLRVALRKLTEQRHVLVATLPSLAADSATLDNVLRDLACAYDDCVTARESRGDVLQYADYCAWLEETAAAGDDDAVAGIAYWHAQNQFRESVVLPFQYPEKASDSAKVGSVLSDIGVSHRALCDAAARQQVSASDFLLACFQTLIGRLAPSRHIVTAVQLPCRGHEELRDALGAFARWAPIHTELPEGASFRSVLARVGAAVREAERWQDYHLDVIDNEARLEPAFGFDYEDSPQPVHTEAGIAFSLIRKSVGGGHFTLRLRCSHTPDSLAATWSYDPRLLAGDDVERVAGHFRAIVGDAVQGDETTADRLAVLTGSQRQQILVGFNANSAPTLRAAAPECIHDRIHDQAQRTPDNVAVVCEDEHLTYRELDARACLLARHLTSLGVGPDVLVAIYMDRSPDIVVALLGVLEAAGAYVPLDPRLPSDRLGAILSDTRPRAVLTSSALRHTLPPHDANVVCLDADWPLISSDRSAASALPRATGANLVYVLFTSGSTGLPKGVAVEHRNLVNYVDSISDVLDLPSGASYACVSTFAADLGNTAIFPALCSGGTLHVISEDRATDADAFAQYFSRHSIDCLKIVPSHLQALLSARHPERVLPKRRLVLGGEAASWNLITKVRELAPDCLVLNHYGPTETTVGASTHRVSANGFDARTASVPIGRPITNARMYVLDSELEPVPIWTRGEIYIGGAGVARGYLNRPDVTAERFIPSPFEAGARLYRTGDIGRYLPDGSIEFLGRTDHQIKIRGFRVELGEIDSILNQCSGVKQAAALLREDAHGGKQIAAYVAAADPRTLKPEALRHVLQSKVPEHMVPSVFFVLDALPLTANGKVDRARLLELRYSPTRDETFVGARTPLERELVQEWERLLVTRPIGIRDNFFDMGGHSLLAVQLIARIEMRLGRATSVAALFEAPTIEQLAARLERRTESESWSSLMVVQPNGSRLPFFWVHGDHSFAILATHLGPDQPLYGLEHQSQDGQPARYTRVEDIAAHYLREVRSAQPYGPYLLGGYSFGAVVAFEMAQQLRKAGELVELLFLLDPSGREWVEYRASVKHEVRRHLRQMVSWNASESWHYVWTRIRGRFEQHVGSPLTRRISMLRMRRCLSRQRPLPPSLRSRYILGVYAQALGEYVPQPYSGPVTLVKSNEVPYKARLDWINLVAGGPRILRLPSDHLDLRMEPKVGQWAGWLKELLEQIARHRAATHVYR